MKSRFLIVCYIGLLIASLDSVTGGPPQPQDSLSTEDASGGSISSDRRAIPNWPQRQEFERQLRMNRMGQDSTFWGSAGPLSNVGSLLSAFLENPVRPGYPIGWNTSSLEAILKQDANARYFIELPASPESQVLTKIIEMGTTRFDSLSLSYSATSRAILRLHFFDSQNLPTMAPLSAEPLLGEIQKSELGFRLPTNTARLLLVIEKDREGYFRLFDLIAERAEGNEN